MSSDGHNLAKENGVTMSFTLVDGTQAMKNIVPFFSFKEHESYESMKESGGWELVASTMMNEQVRERRIKFYFVADMKTMLITLGYKAANSRNACIFCKCSKERWALCGADNKCDFRGEIRESNDGIVLPKLKAGDPGFKNEPLISSELFDGVILDVMHLYLRVTDAIFSRAVAKMSKKGIQDFFSVCGIIIFSPKGGF